MLPKQQRLTSNRIEHLLRKGKKTGDSFITVKYLPNRQTFSRFCIVVSAKTLPDAVDRNRIRRQLYEILRLNLNLFTANLDFAIITKPPLTKLKFEALRTEILTTLTPLK